MRAVDRLFWARCDFDDAWRAHSAAMRSTLLVKSISPEGGPLLRAALSMSKGFEAGFDADFALEHLLDEIQHLQDSDFFPLRKNCLLGVCSSFEDFAKTCAASLSYEPNWRQLPEGKRLMHETDGDFEDRFCRTDGAWKNGYEKFLLREFPWLTSHYAECVADVFWLRNQLTHNANRARDDRSLPVCSASLRKGEFITLGGDRLRLCVQSLKEVVRLVSDETPYLEAI